MFRDDSELDAQLSVAFVLRLVKPRVVVAEIQTFEQGMCEVLFGMQVSVAAFEVDVHAARMRTEESSGDAVVIFMYSGSGRKRAPLPRERNCSVQSCAFKIGVLKFSSGSVCILMIGKCSIDGKHQRMNGDCERNP